MLVDTRCGNLFVQTVGEGPPIALWHSLLCDGGMWREQLRVLSKRFTCINIDAPGHGRSAVPPVPYTMDDCVDAALCVLDALDQPRVAWCGLSWGGMVGMRLAARHPDRIAALILMDTSAHAESAAKKLAYQPLRGIIRAVGPVRSLGFVGERLFFSSRTRAERRDLVDDFVSTFTRIDKRSLSLAVEGVVYGRDDVTDELGRIEAPTLVVVGAEDRATPPRESHHLKKHIPGATLLTVPAAGHLSALERPDVVNPALLEFLESRTL